MTAPNSSETAPRVSYSEVDFGSGTSSSMRLFGRPSVDSQRGSIDTPTRVENRIVAAVFRDDTKSVLQLIGAGNSSGSMVLEPGEALPPPEGKAADGPEIRVGDGGGSSGSAPGAAPASSADTIRLKDPPTPRRGPSDGASATPSPTVETVGLKDGSSGGSGAAAPRPPPIPALINASLGLSDPSLDTADMLKIQRVIDAMHTGDVAGIAAGFSAASLPSAAMLITPTSAVSTEQIWASAVAREKLSRELMGGSSSNMLASPTTSRSMDLLAPIAPPGDPILGTSVVGGLAAATSSSLSAVPLASASTANSSTSSLAHVGAMLGQESNNSLSVPDLTGDGSNAGTPALKAAQVSPVITQAVPSVPPELLFSRPRAVSASQADAQRIFDEAPPLGPAAAAAASATASGSRHTRHASVMVDSRTRSELAASLGVDGGEGLSAADGGRHSAPRSLRGSPSLSSARHAALSPRYSMPEPASFGGSPGQALTASGRPLRAAARSPSNGSRGPSPSSGARRPAAGRPPIFSPDSVASDEEEDEDDLPIPPRARAHRSISMLEDPIATVNVYIADGHMCVWR